VGQEVRDAGHGPEPSGQAWGRHALQVRRAAVEGRRRRAPGAGSGGRDLRGVVLAGGTVDEDRRALGRGSEGLASARPRNT